MNIKKILFYLFSVSFLFSVSIFLSFGDDNLSYYSAAVSQKIMNGIKNGQFPRMIVPRGKIKTILDIIILPDGAVYLVKIAESSGIDEFDQEAKNFVRELAPYPVFSENGRKRLEIRVPIEVVGENNPAEKEKVSDISEAESSQQNMMDLVKITLDDQEGRKIWKANARADADNLFFAKQDFKKDIIDKSFFEGNMDKEFLKEKNKISGLAAELKKLYKTALENSEPEKVSKEQLDLARIKVRQTWRDLFPKVEMQYSVSEGETITDPYTSKAYALQLRQNLFDNGKTAKTVRKERLNLEVAQKEYDKTVEELRFEIMRSYLNVIGRNEEFDEVSKFSDAVSKDYNLAAEIYKAGAISRIEFVEIEAEYQRTINMISQISNELDLAKEKLRASMNLSETARIPIEEVSLPILEDMPIDVDNCVKLALENKPDVRLWEISMEAARYAKDIAASESVPHFNVVTSYGASGESYAEQDLKLAKEWKAMGVVTWLFGGNSFEVSGADERISAKEVTELSRKTATKTYSTKMGVMDKMEYYVQKKEAEIAYAQNISNLSKNKQEVIFDTRKSFLEYRQSFDEYKVAMFEDKFSNINLELKKESFKIGKANLSEVVKVRADHMRKRQALIRAKTSHFISLASLDKSTAYSLKIFE